MIIKNVENFAAVTHLAERLSLKTLLTLDVRISHFLSIRRPRVSITEQNQFCNFVLENLNKKLSIKILSPGIKRFKM
jgi:hypothetical protein